MIEAGGSGGAGGGGGGPVTAPPPFTSRADAFAPSTAAPPSAAAPMYVAAGPLASHPPYDGVQTAAVPPVPAVRQAGASAFAPQWDVEGVGVERGAVRFEGGVPIVDTLPGPLRGTGGREGDGRGWGGGGVRVRVGGWGGT